MTSTRKNPAPAATGTGQNENLGEHSMTTDTTGSTATATRPRRPLVFHAQVRNDDANTVHALCGITWPRRRAVSARQAPGEPGVFCADCHTLGLLNDDLGSGNQ